MPSSDPPLQIQVQRLLGRDRGPGKRLGQAYICDNPMGALSNADCLAVIEEFAGLVGVLIRSTLLIATWRQIGIVIGAWQSSAVSVSSTLDRR